MLRGGGEACYSNTTTLTTGSFGEWRTEQTNVGINCNDNVKDYYLEIKINNITETPRRLLKSFKYIRQDVPIVNVPYNYSGTARWLIKNLNSDNKSNTLISVINDAGKMLSIGITSSTYFSPENNQSFANQPSIGQSSFNDLYFIGGRYTGFKWFTNPNNDTSNIISNIMGLDKSGNLNVTGNITTTKTGFFSFLGSLTNRINKLFVRDIDASRDIVVGRNLEVFGNVEINGTLELPGNVEVGGEMIVGGNLEVGGNMEVAGCIEYNGGSLGICV